MLKKEIIYREMLTASIENNQFDFKQLALSKKFGFSLSTVNNAIRPLSAIGAVEIAPRGFRLVDLKKALLYWATVRKFDKDVVYRTRVEESIGEIERSVPASAVFTCYTGYKFLFRDTPADYSEVYFYLPEEDLEEVERRFPEGRGPANIFVLTADKWLLEGIVPKAQLFVDLWNLKTWYAKDFVQALEERLGL
jgi:hypothetical protein